MATYIDENYWKSKYEILKKRVCPGMAREILMLELIALQEDYSKIKPVNIKYYDYQLIDTLCFSFWGGSDFLMMYNRKPVRTMVELYNSMGKYMINFNNRIKDLRRSVMISQVLSSIRYKLIEKYRYEITRDYKKFFNMYDPPIKINDFELVKKILIDDICQNEFYTSNIVGLLSTNKNYFHEFEYYFRTEIENHPIVMKLNSAQSN